MWNLIYRWNGRALAGEAEFPRYFEIFQFSISASIVLHTAKLSRRSSVPRKLIKPNQSVHRWTVKFRMISELDNRAKSEKLAVSAKPTGLPAAVYIYIYIYWSRLVTSSGKYVARTEETRERDNGVSVRARNSPRVQPSRGPDCNSKDDLSFVSRWESSATERPTTWRRGREHGRPRWLGNELDSPVEKLLFSRCHLNRMDLQPRRLCWAGHLL